VLLALVEEEVVEVELQQLEELSMIKALLSPQPLIEC
jgi:hypothetical protein